MKSLLMGLGVVYFAGFLVSTTYILASQGGWDDVLRAFGYGATWPIQVVMAGP
jgi:hypothetical protein